jgi:probable lipoprotein NlpC
MIPAYIRHYVGIPFKPHGRTLLACDCYGLLFLVFRQEFHIELPSYETEYASALDRQEIARLIAGERTPWQPVPTDEARLGDAVCFRIAGDECHIGLVVDPPWFIHAQEGTDSCLQRWDAIRWRARTTGIYRHEAMA